MHSIENSERQISLWRWMLFYYHATWKCYSTTSAPSLYIVKCFRCSKFDHCGAWHAAIFCSGIHLVLCEDRKDNLVDLVRSFISLHHRLCYTRSFYNSPRLDWDKKRILLFTFQIFNCFEFCILRYNSIIALRMGFESIHSWIQVHKI